jgi:hypothetical protein
MRFLSKIEQQDESTTAAAPCSLLEALKAHTKQNYSIFRKHTVRMKSAALLFACSHLGY